MNEIPSSRESSADAGQAGLQWWSAPDAGPPLSPSERSGFLRVGMLAALISAAMACFSDGGEKSAIQRGDEAWARGDVEEAIAEYQLAMRTNEDDPIALARAAHTYGELGRVDEARDLYRRAVARDPRLADQAAADLLYLARRAHARGDGYDLSRAVEAALELQPGVGVQDLALPLAEYYYQGRRYPEALAFYRRALPGIDERTPASLLYDLGRTYEEVGDCERALVFLEEYADRVVPWRREIRSDVEWHIGSCAFELGKVLERDGDHEAALESFERVTGLGEPRTVQAEAWFRRGEVLICLDRREEALEAFSRVREAEVGGGGLWVDRAEARSNELRFRDPGGGIEIIRRRGGRISARDLRTGRREEDRDLPPTGC